MREHVLRRLVSPLLFALVGFSFLVPFATVSCDNARTSFTGVQLVTRSVPPGGLVEDEGKRFQLGDRVEDDASIQAAVALAAAVVGVVLGALGVSRGPGICAAVGLVAMVLLAAQAFQPLGPTVDFDVGFALAFALYLLLAVLHAALALERRRRRRALAVPLSGPEPSWGDEP